MLATGLSRWGAILKNVVLNNKLAVNASGFAGEWEYYRRPKVTEASDDD
jgi:hypothetical protein